MKNILLIALSLSTAASYAEVEVVPLDMELGYWEIRAEVLESEAINNMLANLPESSRDQVRKMMQSKAQIPIVKQCITSDSFKNFEEKYKESMGGESSCEFQVTTSTSEEFIGELLCDGNKTDISTKVVDSKRQISDVVSSVPGVGETKIQTIAEWKSTVCPEGVAP